MREKMERGATYTLLLFLATALQVYALPYGAPSPACSNIYPSGHDRPLNRGEASSNPFKLDLTPFLLNRTGAAGYYYQPGVKYQIMLSGGGEEFRGFLVQARVVADESPAGSFSDFTDNSEESLCTPYESAVTHSNSYDKESEVLTWTAPKSGTGPLRFLYAVVVEFRRTFSSLFYATMKSDILQEVPTSSKDGGRSGTGETHTPKSEL